MSKSCPICKKPRSEKHAPFCSDRCRDRDLAKWFGDSYAVPGRAALPEEIASEVVTPQDD
jgi:endogenous inhibitor of DNA gyrase (YacG/DUF329 family)